MVAGALTAGAVASGCGPREKFCPNTTDGVCIKPVDAGPKDLYEAPAMEMGSMYFGSDSNGSGGTGGGNAGSDGGT